MKLLITRHGLKKLVATYETLEACAVALGVHPNSLRNWLTGRRKPSRMAQQRIAALLNGGKS